MPPRPRSGPRRCSRVPRPTLRPSHGMSVVAPRPSGSVLVVSSWLASVPGTRAAARTDVSRVLGGAGRGISLQTKLIRFRAGQSSRSAAGWRQAPSSRRPGFRCRRLGVAGVATVARRALDPDCWTVHPGWRTSPRAADVDPGLRAVTPGGFGQSRLRFGTCTVSRSRP